MATPTPQDEASSSDPGPRRTTRRGSWSGRGPRRRPNRLVVDEATNDDNSIVALHPDTMEHLQSPRTLAPPLCARHRPVLSPPTSVLLSSKPAAEARGPGVRRSRGSPVLASKPAAEARVSCRGEGVDHGVPPARVEAGDGGARPRRSPWRSPTCSARQGPDRPDRSAASSRSSPLTTPARPGAPASTRATRSRTSACNSRPRSPWPPPRHSAASATRISSTRT
ncbi:hypothetical protein QYE76_003578 [Lolium multiflorum]|uniref:Uncharacterized protein n=1 Tax=Lolium multiflorum TaxID=4521 RepID=A0AAD8RP02_LOLMU|nr:hypothetical protein QYE76_003578 [Lolium multiflorum]